jgi:hypothetical protein
VRCRHFQAAFTANSGWRSAPTCHPPSVVAELWLPRCVCVYVWHHSSWPGICLPSLSYTAVVVAAQQLGAWCKQAPVFGILASSCGMLCHESGTSSRAVVLRGMLLLALWTPVYSNTECAGWCPQYF